MPGPVDPVTVDCNGATAGSGLPLTLQPGESVTCTFVKTVSGNAGDVVHDQVEVTGTDNDGGHPSDTGDATCPSRTSRPSCRWSRMRTRGRCRRGHARSRSRSRSRTCSRSPRARRRTRQSTTSPCSPCRTTSSATSMPPATSPARCGGVTKAWPITIGPGQSIVCTVTRNVTGSPSAPHTNTATATGFDSDHPNGCAESSVEPFCKKASDNATVTFTPRRRRRTCRTAT